MPLTVKQSYYFYIKVLHDRVHHPGLFIPLPPTFDQKSLIDDVLKHLSVCVYKLNKL